MKRRDLLKGILAAPVVPVAVAVGASAVNDARKYQRTVIAHAFDLRGLPDILRENNRQLLAYLEDRQSRGLA